MSTTPLTSIRTSEADSDDDSIQIVNQLLLPHTVEWIKISTPEEAHDAIKTMKIRGAPAIASLAALSVSSLLKRMLGATPEPDSLSSAAALRATVIPVLDFLSTARPTAVNLGAAMRRLRGCLETSVSAGKDARTIAQELVVEGRLVADEDLGRNKAMARLGAEYLLEGSGGTDSRLNVLTVCNTGSLATSGYGTALGLITHLHEIGRLGRAFYTQTAPYHQGSRLTALELQTLGIPSTMICDTMVGSLFQSHKIHAVVVGADRIAKNGDTANKIGTYNAAVLATRHGIPFVVVAPVSTVDLEVPDGASIPIEHRPPEEACLVRGALYPPSFGAQGRRVQAVVQITPSGLQGIYNPSFDVTPADLITAIVTEKGIAVREGGKKVIDLSDAV